MIKIAYLEPSELETSDDIAKSNIMLSDKFKKPDYFEMSCISWLKIDSTRDYQDLEQFLRFLDLDSHVIAVKPDLNSLNKNSEGLELNMPNENKEIKIEQLEYMAKISCKSKSDAMKELLSYHSSYEENFECLKKTGCLMIKKMQIQMQIQMQIHLIK